MEKLILVVIGILLVDIYLRIRRINALRDATAIQVDVINQLLVSKKFFTREEAKRALGETLNKLDESRVKRLRKNLRSIGVELK